MHLNGVPRAIEESEEAQVPVVWTFFIVETDAQTLVWLLNQPPNDLPNAMLTRWLSYILLFNFDVRHVKGERNGGADGLSRGKGPEDSDDEGDDVDGFFDARMNSARMEDGRDRHLIEHMWMDEDLG